MVPKVGKGMGIRKQRNTRESTNEKLIRKRSKRHGGVNDIFLFGKRFPRNTVLRWTIILILFVGLVSFSSFLLFFASPEHVRNTTPRGEKGKGKEKDNVRDALETLWGPAVRRPSHEMLKHSSYPPLTLQHITNKRNTEKEVFSALSFLLPPTQRREALMEKLNKVMSFGTRVAGSFSSGHQQMLQFIAAEGQWKSPLNVLFSPLGVGLHTSSAPRWELRWDNFTSDTPLGSREFFNLVFHFDGGRVFKRLQEEGENEKSRSEENFQTKTTTRQRVRPSFAAINDNDGKRRKRRMSSEKLRHVVLSAHWDSKYFTDFEFLGASDSALPVMYLLETMRVITVLSDTSDIIMSSLKAESKNDDMCLHLHRVLSQEYREVLRYYYADDESFINCLTGKRVGRENMTSSSFADGSAWEKLLRHVDHLPAITVMFFDGEEAFVSWEDNDHTYGSRHLSKLWKGMTWNNKSSSNSSNNNATSGGHNSASTNTTTTTTLSYFDSIDLFVLYDLMGPAGTQFHNYFPNQSGMAFQLLAELELSHRVRAEQLTCLSEKFSGHNEKEEERKETKTHVCSQQLPEIWCRHGTPYDVYTLHGLPQLLVPSHNLVNLSELWIPPPPSSKHCQENNNNNNNNSLNHRIRQQIRNIFFPMQETLAQGSLLGENFTVDDDHIHWMETQRVLHLIPIPFPPSWHTVRDDGREIDKGTAIDLLRVLVDFVLRLGEGWMYL